MWAMLQAAGAVLSRFGAKYPAVKWAVIALVGLFAVEFVAKEAIDVWVKLGTARPTVEQANFKALQAAKEACAGFLDGNGDHIKPECAAAMGGKVQTPAPAPVVISPEERRRAALALIQASPVVTAPDGRRVYAMPFDDKGNAANGVALPDQDAPASVRRSTRGEAALSLYGRRPEWWVTAN